MADVEEREELDDYQAMEAVRDGKLPSPTKYGEFWLFDLRVTGTGAAWREAHQEYAYRDPELWTSDELVKRANGLPVIFDHPEGSGLNSEEWKNRSIGTVMLPYVKGEGDDAEVWGIAKVFDEDAADLMRAGVYASTSPGVTPGKGSKSLALENGDQVLAEGLPLIFDHLAVCALGVWDKEGPPTGVRLDSIGKDDKTVAEKTVAELEKELAAANARADAAISRADSAEEKLSEEREDAKRKDEEREAARRKDEDEKEAIRAAEKAKDDARKAKHDEAKHDGSHKDCAKCDAAEEEPEEKKDANIDADRLKQIADEKEEEKREDARRDSTIAEMQKTIDRLQRNLQPPSDRDAAALAAAHQRADSVMPMFGLNTLAPYPNENPQRYRRRLADALRPYTRTFKDEAIHEALSGRAFDIIEDQIYDEALAEAKAPSRTDAQPGRLIERVTHANGKTRTEFFGDALTAWRPWIAPVLNITRFNKPQHGEGAR